MPNISGYATGRTSCVMGHYLVVQPHELGLGVSSPPISICVRDLCASKLITSFSETEVMRVPIYSHTTVMTKNLIFPWNPIFESFCFENKSLILY